MTKPIIAWGVLDHNGKLCPGHLYPAKKYALHELNGSFVGAYKGFKPVRVKVSVYKKVKVKK